MSKAKRMPATEFRVHLGKVLRNLDRGDVIIEKGGVPVARVTRYAPDVPTRSTDEHRGTGVSRAAVPGAWERFMESSRTGQRAFRDAERMKRDIYRRREEQVTMARYYDLGTGGEHSTDVPPRQRRNDRPRGASRPRTR